MPWLAAAMLATPTIAQTTSKTADDIDRELAAIEQGSASRPDGAGGVTVTDFRPVGCMFDCGAVSKPKARIAVLPRLASGGAPASGYIGHRITPVAVSGAGTAPRRALVDMGLTFANGSDQLDRASVPELDKYVEALGRSDRAGRRFAIEGHTNSVGAPDRNLDLSRRRAQTVVDYLVGHGIDRMRLEPRGLGQAEPLPDRRGEDPANRRVEIKPL